MDTRQAIWAKANRMAQRPSSKTALSVARRLSHPRVPWSTPPLVADVQNYQHRRLNHGAKPATINREVGFARAACREAGIAWPQVRGLREKPKTRVLTRDEYEKIEAALPPWPKHLAIVLVGTGMRIGEALHLLAGDIKYEFVTGRVEFMVRDPKEGDDKLVIGGKAAGLAASWLYRNSGEVGLGRPDSTPQADHDLFAYHLSRACEATGVQHTTPHDLRRTFGSWALDAGATLEQVAQCLGHRSVDTTRRCYGRIDPATRAKVAGLVMP